MAKVHVRKSCKGKVSIDIRCLSYDEYKMLSALVISSYVEYEERGAKGISLSSFDLHYIEPTVFACTTRLNTLAKLVKLFRK